MHTVHTHTEERREKETQRYLFQCTTKYSNKIDVPENLVNRSVNVLLVVGSPS